MTEHETVSDQGEQCGRARRAASRPGCAAARWRPGSGCPPCGASPPRSGSARSTVAAALAELRRRGVVRDRAAPRHAHRPGAADRIVARAAAGAARAPATSRAATPIPRCCPTSQRALARCICPARLYGEPAGARRAARRSRASSCARTASPASKLCVVSGALDGIERVLQAHLRPGDRVAVENPGYAALFDLLRAHGLRARAGGASTSAACSPTRCERALARGAAAAVITPRGQNPTGARARRRARRRAARGARRASRARCVIEDDHLGAVAGSAPAHALALAAAAERWAATRSVAKALGPGPAPRAARRRRRRPSPACRAASSAGPGGSATSCRRSCSRCGATRGATRWSSAPRDATRAARAAARAPGRATGSHAHGASGLNVWVPVPEEAARVGALMQRGWVRRARGALPARRRPAGDARHDRHARPSTRPSGWPGPGRDPRPRRAQPQRVGATWPRAQPPAREPSRPRAAAPTPSCAACSSAAPTPTRVRRRGQELDARDRALAMRLAYGAIQRRGTLDHLIEQLAERRAGALDPPLLAALRLGLYELLYLQRRPRLRDRRRRRRAGQGARPRRPRARQRGAASRRTRGTRRAARRSSPTTRPSTPRSSTPTRSGSRGCGGTRSAPEQARALMAADNEPTEVALRANTLVHRRRRRSPQQLPVRATRSAPSPRRWCWRGHSTRTAPPLWQQGAFHAQSRAAMLVARALDPQRRRARARSVRRPRRQDARTSPR